MGQLVFRTLTAALPLLVVLLLPFLRADRAALPDPGALIEARELTAYLLADGGFVRQLGPETAGYTANFDADGFGSFGWQFTHTTGAPLTGLRLVVFLDADIDRSLNTFFNEYGTLVALSLPPGAPAGSLAPSAWEIDEPGFLFGDITQHLVTGSLDNTNGVPSGAPEDVSLALGFQFGTLAPGASLTASFLISQTEVGGLSQTDPDSDHRFHFNGYLRRANAAPVIVPARAFAKSVLQPKA